jgi:hypothetical protein
MQRPELLWSVLFSLSNLDLFNDTNDARFGSLLLFSLRRAQTDLSFLFGSVLHMHWINI